MYVCICTAVTDKDIRKAVDRGACSLSDVQNELPVGACCGRCADIRIEPAQASTAAITASRAGKRDGFIKAPYSNVCFNRSNTTNACRFPGKTL